MHWMSDYDQGHEVKGEKMKGISSKAMLQC